MVIAHYKWLSPCSISSNIRKGLLEAFYGIYEKDPDKVIISQFGPIIHVINVFKTELAMNPKRYLFRIE